MKQATFSIRVLLTLALVASTVDSLELVDNDFKIIGMHLKEPDLSSYRRRNLKRQASPKEGLIRILKRRDSPTEDLC